MNQEIFQNREWNELIFESRNKAYGAYVLRLEHEKNTAMGLLFSLGGLFFLFAGGFVYNKLRPAEIPVHNPEYLVPVEPIKDYEIIPEKKPEAPATEAPKTKQFKFTEMQVVQNQPVDQVPTQEQLTQASAGTSTVSEGQTGSPANLTESGTGETGNTEELPEMLPPGVVEVMPQFPGGDAAMMQYLTKHTHYSEEAKIQGIQGSIFVNFTVNKEGKTENISIARGLCCGLNEIAMQAIRDMPAWEPGRMGKRAVKVPLTLKISFRLK